jgi:hypothetical protein
MDCIASFFYPWKKVWGKWWALWYTINDATLGFIMYNEELMSTNMQLEE